MSRSTFRQPTASDTLVRGVILALIGLIVLIAPHFMHPSSPLRDMLVHAHVVGWFALVLGLAFIGKDGLRRLREKRGG
jgi:uncharacterized membrane protein